MKRLIVAGAMLAGLALPATALADSGSYSTSDGPSCTWNGSGNYATIDCSGYSRYAGRYVNYTCDLYFYSGGSQSWSCRDRTTGATWRGSN